MAVGQALGETKAVNISKEIEEQSQALLNLLERLEHTSIRLGSANNPEPEPAVQVPVPSPSSLHGRVGDNTRLLKKCQTVVGEIEGII